MEASSTAEAIRPVKMSRPQMVRLVMVLGAMTAFGAMSIDMYLPAFPSIAHDLHVPLGTIQLTISAFLFGSAIGQLFYGPLADRWGRRRPLLMGLALYVASAVGCASVHSAEALIWWRVVMAVGGGAGMVISRAVVRDLYDTAEAARMFSLLMLVMGAAPILAPLLGGQLLLLTGWRGIFAFLGVFGLASLCAAAMYLPDSLPPERRIRRSVTQMASIYAHLLRNRNYLRYAVALGCVAGTNFSYISGAPFFFIEHHGISPQHFGVFFGANAFGLIGASQVNRRLLRHFSPQNICKAAFAANATAALFLTATVIAGKGGFIVQLTLLFVSMCMTGLLYPNITALAMAPFDKAAGSASALLGTIQYTIGASAGAAVALLQNGTPLPMTAAIAICGVAGSTAVLLARPGAHHHFSDKILG